MTHPPRSHRSGLRAVVARLVALLGAALAVAACTSGDVAPQGEPVRTEPTMQPDHMVDLTVYFRSGEGSAAYLQPVTRAAPITDDLPLTAVTMLIAGPDSDDPRGLSPCLPPQARVLGLSVDDGTAHLDLSHEVISQADGVNPSEAHEALALAAIAGTLTEFPTIDRVRLTVEGAATGRHDGVEVGRFWGGWGLPEVLVRDESVMSEPTDSDRLPDLSRFSKTSQHLGASVGDDVAVTRVRVRDRTTYLRVVVELATVDDPDASAAVPPARARQVDDRIVLEVEGIAAYDTDVESGERLELDDPSFGSVVVEDAGGERLRIVVRPTTRQDFWLHDQSTPTRIILDVRK